MISYFLRIPCVLTVVFQYKWRDQYETHVLAAMSLRLLCTRLSADAGDTQESYTPAIPPPESEHVHTSHVAPSRLLPVSTLTEFCIVCCAQLLQATLPFFLDSAGRLGLNTLSFCSFRISFKTWLWFLGTEYVIINSLLNVVIFSYLTILQPREMGRCCGLNYGLKFQGWSPNR